MDFMIIYELDESELMYEALSDESASFLNRAATLHDTLSLLHNTASFMIINFGFTSCNFAIINYIKKPVSVFRSKHISDTSFATTPEDIFARFPWWAKRSVIAMLLDESKNDSSFYEIIAPIISPFGIDPIGCFSAILPGSFSSQDIHDNLPLIGRFICHDLSRLISNIERTRKDDLLQSLKEKHSQESIDMIIERRDELKRGVESKLTILFTDIRGFSKISEQLGEAEPVFKMLRQYFSAMFAPIKKNRGFIDKTIGDAIMAVFGLFDEDSSGAADAVRAASEMLEELEIFNQKQKELGLDIIRMGIGVDSSAQDADVMIGNLGEEGTHVDLTVIGKPVNKASRIESATKNLHHWFLGEKQQIHPIDAIHKMASFYPEGKLPITNPIPDDCKSLDSFEKNDVYGYPLLISKNTMELLEDSEDIRIDTSPVLSGVEKGTALDVVIVKSVDEKPVNIRSWDRLI